jgi:aquaporin Z
MSADMIQNFLAEGIGSFILAIAVLVCVDSKNKNILPGDAWIKIGLTLAVIVLIFSPVSGAMVNPLLSVVFYLNDELSMENLGVYVVAQLLGGVLALTLFKYFKNSYIVEA